MPQEASSTSIRLRGRVIDTAGPPPEVEPRLRARAGTGGRLMLVQFSGPVRDRWREEIAARGPTTFISYLPDNAYLVWTDGAAAEELSGLVAERSFLQWVGDFHPAYKLGPDLTERALEPAADDEVALTVQLVAHEGVAASEREIVDRSLRVIRRGWDVGSYRNLRVVVAASYLAEIAALPDVVNLERYLEPGLPRRPGT